MFKKLLFTFFTFLLSIPSVGQNVPQYVPTDSLVGWWPFTGNANDVSGNGLNGTVYNSPSLVSDRFGNANSAYSFNWTGASYGGNWQKIEIPTVVTTGEFTINAWIKPSDYCWPNNSIKSAMIVGGSSQCANSNGDIRFALSGNDGALGFRHNSQNGASNTGAIDLNVWQMTTLIVKSDSVSMYVDATKIASFAHNFTPGINSCLSVGLHHQGNGHWYYFNGAIDDLGIWNRALTLCEVQDLYNSNTGSCALINSSNTVICSGDSITLTATVYPQTNCVNGIGEWEQILTSSDLAGYTISRNSAYSFDTTSGIYYSVNNGSIVALDLINKSVSQISSSGGSSSISNAVYNYSDGKLYGHRVGRDVVYSVSTSGGAWASVGTGSFDGNSYSSLDFYNAYDERIGFFGGYGYYAVKNWIYESTASGWVNSFANNNNCNSLNIPSKRIAGGIAPNKDFTKIYVYSGMGNCSGSQTASSCTLGSAWATDVGVYCWLKDLWEYDFTNDQFTNILPNNHASIPIEGEFTFDYNRDIFYLLGGWTPSPTYQSGYGNTATNSNLVFRFDRGNNAAGFDTVNICGTPPPIGTINQSSGIGIFDSPRDRILWLRTDGVWAINLSNSSSTSSTGSFLWSTGDTTSTISVSPSSTTKYWVRKTIDSDTIIDTITVYVLDPTISTTSSNNTSTTLCESDSLLLFIDDTTFANPSDTLYFNDFESTIGSEFNTNKTTSFNSSGVLGNFGDQTITLTLSSLPLDSVRLSFDLWIHDSWDGNSSGVNGTDSLSIHWNQNSLLHTTFNNHTAAVQSYPDNYPANNPAKSGSILSASSLCFAGGSTKYNLSFDINNTSSNSVIRFDGSPNQSLCDESWSIDNVLIRTIDGVDISSTSWSTGETGDSIWVSPSENTTYWVERTVNGVTCSDTISIEVLNVTASASSPTICAGDSVTLSMTDSAANTSILIDSIGQGINSNWSKVMPTTSGKSYRLRIQGEWTAGTYCPSLAIDPAYVNPGYYTATTTALPRAMNTSSASGLYVLGAAINRPQPDVYNPTAHAYDYYFTATSNSIQVGWYDNLLGDNCGSASFALYEEQSFNSSASILWSTGDTSETIQVAPTETTTYWVQKSIDNGSCSDTVTVTVVNTQITASSTTVCESDSVLLYVPSSNSTPVQSCGDLPSNLENGLVAWYPFCGNANDESGNANHLASGTNTFPTTTVDRFGKTNRAYSFDGANSFLSTYIPFNSAFTISIWTKHDIGIIPTGWTNKESIFAYGSSSCNEATLLEVKEGSSKYNFGPWCSPNLTNTTLDTNWHLLVVLYDGSNFRLFRDTTQIGIQTNIALTQTDSLLIIGKNIPPFYSFWNGDIDDVGYWNRVLTESEITQLYSSGESTTWSTGETSDSIWVSPSENTTYWVERTVNGVTCSDTISIEVLNVTASASSSTICAGDSVTLEANVESTYPSLSDSSLYRFMGYFDGKAYYESKFTATYQRALINAQNIGGELLKVNNSQENSFISANMSNPLLLGANDSLNEGTFTWTDGTTLNYSNWLSGEPNNAGNGSSCRPYGEDYIILLPGGSWNDVPNYYCGTQTPKYYGLTVDSASTVSNPSILWSTGDTTLSIIVSPTETTSYWVKQLGNSGYCSDTVTITVLNTEITASSTTLCKSDSVLLFVPSLSSTSNIIPAQPCADLPANLENGLVAWYPFCGNANDESGNGYNGTVDGAILTTDRNGISTHAYSFDGNDKIDIGNPALLGNNPTNYTQSAWVLFNDFSSINVIGSKRHADDGSDWATARSQPDSVVWFYADDKSYVNAPKATTSSLNRQTWYHFTFVKNSNSYLLYLNGSLADSSYDTHSMGGSSYNYIIGAQLAWPHYMNGKLDDFGLWNRALTAAEVVELYNVGSNTTWSTGETGDSIWVSPTENTTYWVERTVNGVTCSDSISIEVLNVNASASSSTICVGDSVTLSMTDSNASATNGNILWSTGNTTETIQVAPTETTTYWVQKSTDNGSCSDTVTVTVINAQITASSTTLCESDSVLLYVPSSNSNITPAQSCADLPSNLENGLVAWYPFCGNANDESGNANNGIVYGATLTSDRNGNLNEAYDYDGSNDYILFGNHLLNSPTEYTISAWVKFNNTTQFSYIFSQATNGEIQLSCVNGQVKSWNKLSSGGSTSIGTAIPDTNQWHHLVAVFDDNNNSLEFYLDQAKFSTSFSSNLAAYFGPAVTGRQSNVNGNFFNGKIDDLGLWNRKLSTAEISQLNNGVFTTWSTGETGDSVWVKPSETTSYWVESTVNGVTCSDTVVIEVLDINISASATTICAGDSLVLNATSSNSSGTVQWSNGDSTASILVHPTETTTYWVQKSTENGSCSDSITITVINSEIQALQSTNCQSDSVLLYVVNAGPNVIWSSGETNDSIWVIPSQNSYYWVESSENGVTCSDTITIRAPQKDLLKEKYFICGETDSISTIFNYDSYQWSTGDTSRTIVAQDTGLYWITVIDSNCTFTDTTTVIYSNLIGAIQVLDSNLCFGDSSASLALISSGGIGALNIQWNTSDTTLQLTNLPAGNYTVYLEDTIGCSYSDSITIADPPLLSVSLSANVQDNGLNISCNGGMDGIVYSIVSGGVQPYTYLWSNNSSLDSAAGLGAGSTWLLVTDANGCSASDTITLTEPTPLMVNASAISDFNGYNISCFGENDGQANVNATGGNGNYSYLWSNGSNNVLALGLSAAIYSVTVTDTLGCTASDTISLTQPLALNTALSSPLNALGNHLDCYLDSTAVVVSTDSGGVQPYSYLWSNSSTADSAAGLSAGSTWLLLTDANGCTASDTITLTEPAPLMVNVSTVSNFNGYNISCFGGDDGQASVTATGGNGNYNYIWSNNDNKALATGLSASTYSVTVTDSLGCSASDTVSLTEPIALSTVLSSPLNAFGNHLDCYLDSTAVVHTANHGGVQPYTYLWSNNSTLDSAGGLGAGTTWVVLTDGNGCTTSDTITITQPAPLMVNASTVSSFNGYNISCFGEDDGQANVIASGGNGNYTYLWSNNDNNALALGLSAETYSVTVTDSLGCSASDSVSLTQPNALNVAPLVTNNQCYGETLGLIEPNPSGGAGGYLTYWSTGDTASYLSALGNGLYSFTIVDGNECLFSDSISIISPDSISTSVEVIPQTCRIVEDGEILIATIGGVGPYDYSLDWMPVELPIDSLASGQYLLSTTDSYGCIKSLLIDVPLGGNDCFQIPNMFSPNADGYNDEFNIQTSYMISYEIIIYNSLGQKIYQSNSAGTPWDGLSNGVEQPSGDYYYVIVTDNGNKIFGYVTLIR
jgi:gliding motility-associated-like protein